MTRPVDKCLTDVSTKMAVVEIPTTHRAKIREVARTLQETEHSFADLVTVLSTVYANGVNCGLRAAKEAIDRGDLAALLGSAVGLKIPLNAKDGDGKTDGGNDA